MKAVTWTGNKTLAVPVPIFYTAFKTLKTEGLSLPGHQSPVQVFRKKIPVAEKKTHGLSSSMPKAGKNGSGRWGEMVMTLSKASFRLQIGVIS